MSEDNGDVNSPHGDEPEMDLENLKQMLAEQLDTELISRNHELEEENERLANELEVIKEALTQYMDSELLGTQNQELQRENDQLQEQLEKSEETIKTLQAEALRREQSGLELRKETEELKEELSLKSESSEVMAKHVHSKAEECEYLQKQVKHQKQEIERWSETANKLREELTIQKEKLQAQLTDTKRRERNKTRALSNQIESAKDHASVVTMQSIEQQKQIRELSEENQVLKRKLNAFEKHKQFADDRESMLKEEVERLLKENQNLESFQIDSLDLMANKFDREQSKEEENMVILGEDHEKKEEQALDSLAEQMRLRSFSDVSDKSDRSSNCDSPKVGPIPAPQMQQIRQPQAPSAELVYTRLCAMAVALKFSHLGHYNSELLKLSKVCIKNNIWKWYEVYDELVKYMENIEETLTGSWEDKHKPQAQSPNLLRKLFFGPG